MQLLSAVEFGDETSAIHIRPVAGIRVVHALRAQEAWFEEKWIEEKLSLSLTLPGLAEWTGFAEWTRRGHYYSTDCTVQGRVDCRLLKKEITTMFE